MGLYRLFWPKISRNTKWLWSKNRPA